MSVSETHPDYDKSKFRWKRCRDVIDGRDAILSAARRSDRIRGSLFSGDRLVDLYLPRLKGQDDEEYFAYAERASFFNATSRTVEAMTGLVFMRDPVVKLPPAMAEIEDDITLQGTGLREFAEEVVEQVMDVGRVGMMLDYPASAPKGLTVAAAEAANIRPFLRWYQSERILNWRCGVVNGRKVLTMVVLEEEHERPVDEFTSEAVTKHRVLSLDGGAYRVRLFSDDVVELDEYPTQNGAPMDYIPFIILGPQGSTPDVQKPPLLDLVDTNLSHYRNSADHEHGLHFTGLPTPYVAGVQLEDGKTIELGSTQLLVFSDPEARVGFMEFTGEGLAALERAMEAKERRMAVLGARMLSDEKSAPEAYGTVELRTAGERSALGSVSKAASDAVSRLLRWMAEWMGAGGEVEFSLNTDFGASKIQPDLLEKLFKGYQTNAIPLEVLFENLKAGEIVSPDMDFERYQSQLGEDAQTMAAAGMFQAPALDDAAGPEG